MIPFKAQKQGAAPPAPKRHHIRALPGKAALEIRFPRVEGYAQAIRNRIAVDWAAVPPLVLEPDRIPPDVEMKALSVTNEGRMTLHGPGRVDGVTLADFRARRRIQELVFDLAQALTREVVAQATCTVPAHALFPQVAAVVARYAAERIRARPPADVKDVFLAPYYGWLVERLLGAIRPDAAGGEAPEIPRYETTRGPGSTADVDFWTGRDIYEVARSHVNAVVADTKQWEQSAAYALDGSPHVDAFVKNAGLGLAIPYLDNGQPHDYLPDFIVRVRTAPPLHLVLEVKGYDRHGLAEVKRAAALRWAAAVTAEGSHGRWAYEVVRSVDEVPGILERVAGRDAVRSVP